MLMLPLTIPPKKLCILRLSAIGDISHTLPILRTIQHAWPETEITWIIGKTEYGLVYDLPDVNFIVFDKAEGLLAYKKIRQSLKDTTFDILLHMQMSVRSSLVSLLINADIKLGFDKQRAKDMQWLFTNHKIEHKPRQHVIDSFFGFTEALGIKDKLYSWDIPIPDDARQFASQYIKDQPVLVISPCSSKAYRNWNCEGYAEVADYAIEKYNMQVILTGGPSSIEKHYGKCIEDKANHKLINLVGKTSIKQLLAIIDKASVVIAPDSGPAHLATAVNTPVIGLYACTNPDRARPYLSEQWLVNNYPQAVLKKHGKAVNELPWGVRVRDEGTMNIISVTDVISKLDSVLNKA